MPRKSSSQWDFGELFSAEETRRVLTVSELTTQVKRLVEQQLGTVWVTGEITNLRRQGSGHIYFTLKDAGSQLACVLFRGERLAHRELMEDGQKLLLQGDITVYEARGQYQLIVRQVELQGIGALQAAFERLKKKLAAEGLFSEERKRPLPAFPQRIGVVSSPTAAALRDVLHVVERRNPALELILAPSRVQGEGAAEEVAAAIDLLNEFAAGRRDSGAAHSASRLDAILVTRGGGSLEDLWAFNEEAVARAIAASTVPVVSAVGHEIDFTISDFTADLRAATPSAAAEILTEGFFSAAGFVAEAPSRLAEAARARLQDSREDVDGVRGRLARAHPRRRLNEAAQRLDDVQAGISRVMRDAVARRQLNASHLTQRFLKSRPMATVETAREEVQRNAARLCELTARVHGMLQERLAAAEARLRLLGPEQVLARGYSITTDAETGKVIRDSAQTRKGQKINTRVHKGTLTSRVEP
jgi:exodeoxyribonuclease VII large subunit